MQKRLRYCRRLMKAQSKSVQGISVDVNGSIVNMSVESARAKSNLLH